MTVSQLERINIHEEMNNNTHVCCLYPMKPDISLDRALLNDQERMTMAIEWEWVGRGEGGQCGSQLTTGISVMSILESNIILDFKDVCR